QPQPPHRRRGGGDRRPGRCARAPGGHLPPRLRPRPAHDRGRVRRLVRRPWRARPMTVTPLPTFGVVPVAGPVIDIEEVLASIDTMAAQRPVAAQIVSVANSDDTSAKVL